MADALGAGSLNSFDRDRMNELGDTARRWAVATEPLWTVLFDTDAPIEGFVAELDARRQDLTVIVGDFGTAVDGIRDAGLEESLRPFAQSLEDQMAAFESLAIAIEAEDPAAIEESAGELDAVIVEATRRPGPAVQWDARVPRRGRAVRQLRDHGHRAAGPLLVGDRRLSRLSGRCGRRSRGWLGRSRTRCRGESRKMIVPRRSETVATRPRGVPLTS